MDRVTETMFSEGIDGQDWIQIILWSGFGISNLVEDLAVLNTEG